MTQTENTDVFTIVFLRPSETGKIEDHLANIHVSASNIRLRNMFIIGTCSFCQDKYVACSSVLYIVLLRGQ